MFSLDNLKLLEDSCYRLRQKSHGGVPTLQKDLEYARTMLPYAKTVCEQMALVSSLRVMDSIMLSLGILFPEQEDEGPDGPIDVAEFETEIRHLRETIEEELKEHGYVHVAADRVKYLVQKHPFGEKVTERFSSAVYDIQEAANCMAVEANTAAVFHLMRAAEHGLRALAHDRRVAMPKGAPIDLATWEEIIRQLENAEIAIQSYPKTAAREAQFKFYHGALMEFKRFKNKFRNGIMHTRDAYDRHEAHSALEHVRDFMRILASQISETKRTPIIWKGKKWTTIEP
jgi:hypothetical protein